MKICPKCGRVVSYNSYFAAYRCENCDWEDNTNSLKRASNTISTFRLVKTNDSKEKRILQRAMLKHEY